MVKRVVQEVTAIDPFFRSFFLSWAVKTSAAYFATPSTHTIFTHSHRYARTHTQMTQPHTFKHTKTHTQTQTQTQTWT